MTIRLGILGGTFDPIHQGHLDLGRAAQTALSLTEVLVVPSNVPPHRPSPEASAFHRFAMVAIAVAARPGWRASDLELGDQERSYATRTLQRLNERGLTPDELFFLIGADAFAEIGTWKDFPSILNRAHFAVVSRPHRSAEGLRAALPHLASRMVAPGEGNAGAGPSIVLIEAPTSNVSSTDIRARRKAGLPISGMVPDGVRQHIEQHGLYGPKPSEWQAQRDSTLPAAGRLHGQG